MNHDKFTGTLLLAVLVGLAATCGYLFFGCATVCAAEDEDCFEADRIYVDDPVVFPTPAEAPLYDCNDPQMQIYCQPTRTVPVGAAQWTYSTPTPVILPTAISTVVPTPLPLPTEIPTETPIPTIAPTEIPTIEIEQVFVVPTPSCPKIHGWIPEQPIHWKHSHAVGKSFGTHDVKPTKGACAISVEDTPTPGYVHQHSCECPY